MKALLFLAPPALCFGSPCSPVPPSPPCRPALMVEFMTVIGTSCCCPCPCPGFGGGCLCGRIVVVDVEDAKKWDCMLALAHC